MFVVTLTWLAFLKTQYIMSRLNIINNVEQRRRTLHETIHFLVHVDANNSGFLPTFANVQLFKIIAFFTAMVGD